MKRLLLAGTLAIGLHGLLFSIEAEWMKKNISHPLSTGPIALVLSYQQSKRTVPKPKNSPGPIQKLSIPLPDTQKKEKSKNEPPKKVKKPIRHQAAKPPKEIKSTRPLRPQFTKRMGKVLPKTTPNTFQAFKSASPLEQANSEIYGEDIDLAMVSVEEDIREKGPSDQKKKPSELSTPNIREAIPLYRQNPPPKYPRLARRRGYQGTVLLEVFVNQEGKVGNLRVFQSSGHSVLDRAAMTSVKNWVFEPGRKGKEKLEMWVKVPIRFQLK